MCCVRLLQLYTMYILSVRSNSNSSLDHTNSNEHGKTRTHIYALIGYNYHRAAHYHTVSDDLRRVSGEMRVTPTRVASCSYGCVCVCSKRRSSPRHMSVNTRFGHGTVCHHRQLSNSSMYITYHCGVRVCAAFRVAV